MKRLQILPNDYSMTLPLPWIPPSLQATWVVEGEKPKAGTLSSLVSQFGSISVYVCLAWPFIKSRPKYCSRRIHWTKGVPH